MIILCSSILSNKSTTWLTCVEWCSECFTRISIMAKSYCHEFSLWNTALFWPHYISYLTFMTRHLVYISGNQTIFYNFAKTLRCRKSSLSVSSLQPDCAHHFQWRKMYAIVFERPVIFLPEKWRIIYIAGEWCMRRPTPLKDKVLLWHFCPRSLMDDNLHVQTSEYRGFHVIYGKNYCKDIGNFMSILLNGFQAYWSVNLDVDKW